MKLSILIPVFNVNKYIKRCLNSVYHQINKDMDVEVIIVDDGSSDGSGKICDEYQSRYPDITYVYHKDNEGAYPTRNFAFDHCHGDYIWFIDPDDYIETDVISKIQNCIIENNLPEVIIMNYRLFNDNSYGTFGKVSLEKKIMTGTDYLNRYVPNPYLWANIYKKKFLTKKNIRFCDSLNTQGDWLFNVEVYVKANKILLSTINAYNYYKGNPTSTLNNREPKHMYRGVENSLLALTHMNELIKMNDNKLVEKPLVEMRSMTTAGFLYSLFRFNFPKSFVDRKLTELEKMEIYPVKKSINNRRANLFLLLANYKLLFLSVIQMRNHLFHLIK